MFPKPTKKDKSVIRECEVCKKPMHVYPYRMSTQKTCSFKCSGISQRTRVHTKCKFCGKEFDFYPSQSKYYKNAGSFCSRECAYKGMIKTTATKSTKDKWGRTRRKDDLAWQKAVRERDGNLCRKCGKYDKYIHTHHIATRKRRPDLKHVVSNGVCLCNSCHTWVHTHILVAQGMGLLSTDKYEKHANGVS